jgi:hypothetical protein
MVMPMPVRPRFWILRGLRKKTRGARFERFKAFAQEIRAASGDSDRILRVLDLGGTLLFWETWWKISVQDRLRVTLLNDYKLHDAEKTRQSSGGLIDNVCQDATTLTPEDLSKYDIIFANSFLEHLRTREAQKALAAMITSSGLPYFIQVPNKFSPIDPHRPYLPFFALYPSAIRSRIGPGPGSKILENGKRWKMDYNPLGVGDMKKLFPTAMFKVEKPLGVPMSILAYHASAAAKPVLA